MQLRIREIMRSLNILRGHYGGSAPADHRMLTNLGSSHTWVPVVQSGQVAPTLNSHSGSRPAARLSPVLVGSIIDRGGVH